MMKIFTAIAVARICAPTELIKAAFKGEVFNNKKNAATRSPGPCLSFREKGDDHDGNSKRHANRGNEIVRTLHFRQQVVAQPASRQCR